MDKAQRDLKNAQQQIKNLKKKVKAIKNPYPTNNPTTPNTEQWSGRHNFIPTHLERGGGRGTQHHGRGRGRGGRNFGRGCGRTPHGGRGRG